MEGWKYETNSTYACYRRAGIGLSCLLPLGALRPGGNGAHGHGVYEPGGAGQRGEV